MIHKQKIVAELGTKSLKSGVNRGQARLTHPPDNSFFIFNAIHNKSAVRLPTGSFVELVALVKNFTHEVSYQLRFCSSEELEQFCDVVLVRKIAGTSPEKLKQVYFHFKKAVEVLSGVGLSPQLWASQSSIIFQRAEDLKIHPSYFPKALRVINELGQFLSALRGLPYTKVPQLDRRSRERLAQLTEERKGRRVAQPLSLIVLNKYRSRLSQTHYNYLYVTLFLGLRPSELDRMLSLCDSWKIVQENGIDFLDIYQGKLTQLSKDSRWKRIPIYETEQKEALRLVQSKQLSRPDGNEMRRVFKGQVKLYSGRKGFAALMLKRGWRFEDASRMLGHSSIRTTEAYYIDAEALRRDRAASAVQFRKRSK